MAENASESSDRIDPATGFLEKNKNFLFGAREKTAFLKHLKKTGNQSRSLDLLGVTNEEFDFHLQKDLVFNKAYRNTLLEMRHELEGNLYTAGLNGSAKEAQMWLQAFFPEVYKPSASKAPKRDRGDDTINALYEKAKSTGQ